ncbi:Rv1476 family membrane protein [Mycobacterium sp. MMS18-G62]
MTGPHVIPFPPTYIPKDVCSTVGLDPATPPDVCMDRVLADVSDDGVSAPVADAKQERQAAELRQVIADARKEGIDLKVVVVPTNPPIDTPLRDIATEVGQANPGSTVLAISPGWAGTYSSVYNRVTLEAGQDVAKTGDPVQSTKNFVSELTTQHFPWTPFTIVVVLAVIAAVVTTRVLQVRAKRSTAEQT